MSADDRSTAAIVTVGSEIVDGIGLDTNTREIASALTQAGYRVKEALSIPDEQRALADALERLTASYELVICTGGLGPTHDDITRQAASSALGRALVESPPLRSGLESIALRHTDSDAREQVFVQALVLQDARVIEATSGTAPGQIVPTPAGKLILLPGPPHEMRPMLESVLAGSTRPPVRVLACVGLTESDAQMTAQRELAGRTDIDLTVLATPGHVRVVLVGRNVDTQTLDDMAARIARELGDACYSSDGTGLAAAVLNLARTSKAKIATAESCTGGLVSAAFTAVPGSSAAFVGGVVAYSNEAKSALLGADHDVVSRHGAVSAETASLMASGALARFDADIAVSVTGIAGPDGGTVDKPVGLVWFAVADSAGVVTVKRDLLGDREGIRERATITALDLIRRRLSDLEVI